MAAVCICFRGGGGRTGIVNGKEVILQAKGIRRSHKRTEESLAEVLTEEKRREEDTSDDDTDLYTLMSHEE